MDEDVIRQVLVDGKPTKTSQGYRLERVWRIRDVSGPLDVRVKVLIYRDFYQRQSRYRVDLWTLNGWTGIYSLDPHDVRIERLGLPHTMADEDLSGRMAAVESVLLDAAEAVLR
jgi:hypothetical protein